MRSLFLSLILTTASAIAAADDSRFATHLHAKFQVKGCTACHDYHEEKLKGIAFSTHKGRKPESCKMCHSQAVSGFAHPEDWFARPNLYTSGMNAKDTCESTKKAMNAEFKSQALLAKEMRKHLLEDPRVLWGVEGATPKSGMLPEKKEQEDIVKGGPAEWKAQVEAWIQAGMPCD